MKKPLTTARSQIYINAIHYGDIGIMHKILKNCVKKLSLSYLIAVTVLFTVNASADDHHRLKLPKIIKTVSTGTPSSGLNPYPDGAQPSGIAFNEKTNRIYVRNRGGDNISVLDGRTNNIIATTPTDPRLDNNINIAVDEKHNRIYASLFADNPQTGMATQSLLIIDGKTNLPIGEIPVNVSPDDFSQFGVITDIQINQKNRKIYMPIFYGQDGAFSGVLVFDLDTQKQIAAINFSDPNRPSGSEATI